MTQMVRIETTDNQIFHSAAIELAGLGFVVETDDVMLKADPSKLRTILVTTALVGGAISPWLPVAEWIYEKCKHNPDEKTVINGNLIITNTTNTQTVYQYFDQPAIAESATSSK